MGRRSWRNRSISAFDQLCIFFDQKWATLKAKAMLWWQGCVFGRNLKVMGPCFIRVRKQGAIVLGKNVRLFACNRANPVGLTNPAILSTMGHGKIEVGDESGISSCVISSRVYVCIGQRVNIGGNVRIFDHDFHSLKYIKRRDSLADKKNIQVAPVKIGDDVFIGTNAMILKGVNIGNRAVVAAGSVVTKDVPADMIVAGNPARAVKHLDN